MRNFKRFLSYVLVFTMLMTTVSCLGSVFTFGAAADDPVYTDYAGNTFAIGEKGTVKTPAEMSAAYDSLYGTGTLTGNDTTGIGTNGWTYLASKSYEVPAADYQKYDLLTNATPTDGYVKKGDYIFTTVTYASSSGVYLGLPTFVFGFSWDFFDFVVAPLSTTTGVLSATNTGAANQDIQKTACRMNQDNGMCNGNVTDNNGNAVGLYFKVATKTATENDIAGNRTLTGLSSAQLQQIGAFQFSAFFTAATVYPSDGSTWMTGFLLKVKDNDSMTDGKMGAIYCPREFYKTAAKQGRFGSNKVAYSPATPYNNAKLDSVNTTLTFITDDFGCGFIIGDKPAEDEGPTTPTDPSVDPATITAPGVFTDYAGRTYPTGEIGTVKTPSEMSAAFDSLYGTGTLTGNDTTGIGTGGWTYLASKSYEVPADDYQKYDILANATPTDGFVMPGDYIFTTVTYASSSNVYLGLPTFVFGFSWDFFEFVVAPLTTSTGILSATNTGSANQDIEHTACRMNQDNGMCNGNVTDNNGNSVGLYFKVATKTATENDIAGNRTLTGLTSAQLQQIGAFQFSAFFTAATVYPSDGSTWMTGFLLKVKNDDSMTIGKTGGIYCPREFYKTAAKQGRFGSNKVAYSPATPYNNAKLDSVNTTLTFITDDFGCSFIIGNPAPVGSGHKATFMNGTATFATQNSVTSATDPGTPTGEAGTTFQGWATEPNGTPVTFPYAISADTTFYAVYATSTYTLTVNYSGAGASTPAAHVETLAYGAAYSVTSPVITGYTASQAVVSGTITGDVTVNVTYSTNTHTVKWFDGSSCVKTDASVRYGNSVASYAYTKEGYTLTGWSLTNGGTAVSFPYSMPDNDVDFYAILSAKGYTVTWIDNNGTSIVDYNYGDTIVVPTPAAKYGYNCSGWDASVPATMGSSSLTFNAVYTPKTCNAIFLDAAGNTFATVPTAFDAAIVAPANEPSKTGYTFNGWSPAVGKMTNEDGMTFQPTWTAKPYTVTYVSDGETYTTAPVNFDASFNAPATPPTKAGYTFGGWSLTEGGAAVTFPYTLTTEGLTLYAVWTQGEASYTFKLTTMNTAGVYVTESSTITSTTGAALDYTNYEVPAGFTLADGSVLTGTVASDNSTVIEVKLSRNKYDFTYTDNDGDHTTQVYYGAALVAPTAAKKFGYAFDSWTVAIPDTMPVGGFTTAANYTIGTFDVTFTDGVNETVVPTQFNAQITKPADAQKDGYTFGGWSLDGETAVEWPQTLTTEGATYTALFTANTYTVTFYTEKNGDVFKTESGNIGKSVYAPVSNPTWPGNGMKFAKWVDEDGDAVTFPVTIGTENIDIYGTWTPNNFYVEFIDADGNAVDGFGGSYAFGTEIATIAPSVDDIPAVPGKQFIGWFITEDYATCDLTRPADKVIASYQIYMAYFAEAQFTVNFFDADGVTPLGSYTGAEGATIVAPTVTAPTGYDFAGWVDSLGNAMPATLTTDGASYYAQYTPHKYAVKYYVNGQLVHTDEVAYLAEIPAYTYTEAGYDIGAWDYVPATMGTEDVEVNATKTPIAYELVIKYSGAGDNTPDEHSEFVAYNAEYSVTVPTITGYTPSVAVVTGTMVLGGAEVSVVYTAIEYDLVITYIGAGDKTPDAYSGKVAYGTEYSVDSPAVTGYTPDVATVTGTMDENGAEVTVTYTINSHDFVYVVEGVASDPVSYEFGAAITKPEDPEKEGNTFTGWSPAIPETMPDEDVTVYAQFSANTYTITWVVDGVETKASYAFGAAVDTPDDPSKTGYHFDGWDAEIPETMPADNITITAILVPNQHYAEFVVDGETVSKELYDFGTVPTAPHVDNKPGYVFQGWDPAITAMPDDDVVYNVVWTEAEGVPYTVNTYTMDFEGEYGEPETDTLYARTGAAVAADDKVLEDGLYYDTEAENYAATGTVAADGSLVLNVFIGRTAYDLTFVIDGRSDTNSVYYGAPIEAPIAQKIGHSFTGWTPALPETMPASAATYTAGFSKNTYEITWNYNNTSKTVPYEFGAAVTAPDPTMTGYAFTGWSVAVPETMVADNITITALYTIKEYTITYKVVGAGYENDVYTTQTYNYQAEITAPEDPVISGNTFSYWNPALPETMPARNLEVEAVFGVNSYTFSYTIDGNTVSKKYAFGASIPAIPTPTKTGYTFDGWDGGDWPTTMPSSDVTLVAKWAVKQFILNYVIDGVDNKESYDYNAVITPMADPEKPGYTFTGWSPRVPDTMPANDYTVVATWSVKSFDATFIVDGTSKTVSTEYGKVPAAPEAVKTGYDFLGWYVTGDDAQTIVAELPVMGEQTVSYTAKFQIKTLNANFDCANGSDLIVVPTVYGAKIEVPEDPTRNGYIFQGWSPVPDTMGAEDMTFVAQWANDLSICSIQSVERTTTPYYEKGYATYVVTVKGSPVKISFSATEGQASWTYDRNLAKVADDALAGGVVSITDNGETGDALVETWTVRIMLPAGTYKVRAKLNYSESSWEDVDTAYEFVNTYDEKEVEAGDKIISVSVDKTTVVRGGNAVWTVVADPSVDYIMFADPNGANTVSFSKTLASVSTALNGDGNVVWTITTRMTYIDAAKLEEDQTFNFKYRSSSDIGWTESDAEAITVKVTKYDDSNAVKSDDYDPYSVVSATAIAGKKLGFTPITVVTTKDVTKVRFTVGAKSATYTETSANTTVSADPEDDNLIIWTIGYRFTAAGDYTVKVESRGNTWSGESTDVAVKIFNTQAEADEYNAAD